jgi:hypothetical protein
VQLFEFGVCVDAAAQSLPKEVSTMSLILLRSVLKVQIETFKEVKCVFVAAVDHHSQLNHGESVWTAETLGVGDFA